MSSPIKIYPIILSGGSGSRLWPLSRSTMPKQFAELLDNESLFQKTIKRFKGEIFAHPTIVSGENSRFIVKNQLDKIKSKASGIIIEPSPRDTAAAALTGIVHISKIALDPIIVISPADHWIKNETYFKNVIKKNISFVTDKNIITFGIRPKFPHTGYGWITATIDKKFPYKIFKVTQFIEKPPLSKAKKLLKNNCNFWNSGIFMGKASTFLNAYEKHTKSISKLVKNSYDKLSIDLDFLRLDDFSWQKIKKISLDYAIIEKYEDINMFPFEDDWSDVGSLFSLKKYYKEDKKQNVVVGNSTIINSKNTFLNSADSQIHLVGLGLENIIAVATKDAVLCVNQKNSEDVKKAVDLLIKNKVEQAKESLNDFRPWGKFEILSKGKNFKVKKIHVHPFCKLSLQSHKHRSEHWVVVEGRAKVTLGEKTINLLKNESVYINSGIKHRLENPSKKILTIIEVQTGNYLGEDDIVRYEDDYKRIKNSSKRN